VSARLVVSTALAEQLRAWWLDPTLTVADLERLSGLSADSIWRYAARAKFPIRPVAAPNTSRKRQPKPQFMRCPICAALTVTASCPNGHLVWSPEGGAP
jgi:hypothetical protein